MAAVLGQEPVITWQDARYGSKDIFASRSHKNGTLFVPNERADDSLGQSMQLEPAVAATGTGTIYVAWQDNRRNTFDYDIYLSKSTDGGIKYGRNVKVDDSNSTISWQERPAIVTNFDGTVFVAWTDDRTGELRVRGAYSLDGGATFSPSKEICPSTRTSSQTGVEMVSDGYKIYAVLMDSPFGVPHPYLVMSSDGGRTFTAPVRLDSTGNPGASQRELTVALIRTGGLVVAWTDARNGGLDIYGCRVSPSGIPGTNFRVDDDLTGAWQETPSLTADKAGDVYAVWEDERNSLFAIRFAYMPAGGSAFTASGEVASPGPTDVQRRPSVTATGPGHVLVVWQDDRSGTDDIYSSMGTVANLDVTLPEFIVNLVPGWNFVGIPIAGTAYTAGTIPGLVAGDMIVSWDPVSQQYDKTFIRGFPFQDFTLNLNDGYWMIVGGPRVLDLFGSPPATHQSRMVDAPSGGGWVIVSFATLNTTWTASDLAAKYTGTIDVVSGFDESMQTTADLTYIIGFPMNDFAIKPGHAYWLHVLTDGLLSYDP